MTTIKKTYVSDLYEVRTHDLSTVLSSGITEDNAILSLCNEYGLTVDEINNNLICHSQIVQTGLRFKIKIISYMTVGEYAEKYLQHMI